MRTRIPVTIILLGLILTLFAAIPVAGTDNAKWFVCKYTGTPGVDEVLQTGDNPISVAAAAIGISPVVPGAWFADSQGRSYVLVEDTGQPEPDPSLCPPPNTATPTPAPSFSPAPSSSAGSSPSMEPSQPTVEAFSVEVCPLTGEPVAGPFAMGMTAQVPEGMSMIRFRHPLLVILLLTVRIDGEEVTLDNFGDVVVTPGVHEWSVSNAEDTEVLATGVVDCPVCDPEPSQPDAAPPEPTPIPDVPDTALPVAKGVGFVAGLMLMILGGLLVLNARSARRR